MNGPWLSLLPVTDSTSSSSSNTTSHHPIHFKSNSRITSHTHDHHPTSNSILKPIILERRPKLKKTIHTHSISTHPHSSNQTHLINSGSSDSNLTLKSSTLLYHQSHHHHQQQQQQDDQKRFEIRNLKVTDLEKVKELHHSTLPITYPTSFFCNLLMREENEIALVATLPSSLPPGYFDLKLQESDSDSISSDSISTHHHHHHHPHHHLLHHVTSPLSGRKPISLDIIGSITSTFKSETNEIRILTLCVDHQYRRHGLGSMLLRSLITQTKSTHPNRLSLHVQATNSIALRFYQRFGFQKSIFKASYYSNQTLKASHHFRSTTSSSTTSDSTTSSSLTSASSTSTSPSSTSTSTSDDGLDEDSNSGRIIQEVDAWFLVLDLSTS